MGNMSYCRWGNTSHDLQDCVKTFDEWLEDGEVPELNERERDGFKSCLQQARKLMTQTASSQQPCAPPGITRKTTLSSQSCGMIRARTTKVKSATSLCSLKTVMLHAGLSNRLMESAFLQLRHVDVVNRLLIATATMAPAVVTTTKSANLMMKIT